MYKVTKLELLQAEITPGNSICLSSVKIDCVQFQHALTTQPCYLPNELCFLLENVSRKVKKSPCLPMVVLCTEMEEYSGTVTAPPLLVRRI